MKSFSVFLVFTLIGVGFGAEQKPAPTPQGKEPHLRGQDRWRMDSPNQGQG